MNWDKTEHPRGGGDEPWKHEDPPASPPAEGDESEGGDTEGGGDTQ